MKISKELLNELTGLQEDVAASFTDENMISGELYWTVVESLATTKIAELKEKLFQISYDILKALKGLFYYYDTY